ncbi:coat protein [Grapevine Pinot gris virus]|uniref:CP n=18 Tax=Grapevine Pinot gris virus TaxID=1051792 RepID=F8LZ65_9VIRU|nr:coat protein [Grapevine Pinot gris virus]QIB70873.1 coat protein [Grapevine Pinot gris virus]UIG83126.1 coat protein [Grapevine Pinot gris virus]UPO25026.1 coat protein [Grapevine Pinot gris virus]UPO25030.1 coat protein [Grapevine Pinot gris virus]UPO25032.1 coat protein [Grapevine Pinot gris virus]
MSIRQELRSTVRRELIAKLSEANQVLHGLTEGNKDLVLDHIFANIAVEGTSGETIYPTTMVKCYESFNPSLPVVKEYSLAEVVNKIRVYKESHTNNDIKLMTFRQVCAAFAIDAQLGLVKFYRLNMHTNIYKKHPKLCDKAPEVAFDFNEGLNFNNLTPNQKSVIQNLNRLLFHVESEKQKTNAITASGESAFSM